LPDLDTAEARELLANFYTIEVHHIQHPDRIRIELEQQAASLSGFSLSCSVRASSFALRSASSLFRLRIIEAARIGNGRHGRVSQQADFHSGVDRPSVMPVLSWRGFHLRLDPHRPWFAIVLART
jgi:hypothetical protein